MAICVTWGRWNVLWLFAVSYLSCIPPAVSLTLVLEYTRENFTGRDISGRSIGICPLLSDSGLQSERRLPSKPVIEMIHQVRPDLSVCASDSVHDRLIAILPDSIVIIFYKFLFEGRVAALQRMDTLWQSINNEYLLVFRLINGMDIRTFNNVRRKKAVIEAELWDRTLRETVWRVSVTGYCDYDKMTHNSFFMEMIKKVVLELPSSLPSYDIKSW